MNDRLKDAHNCLCNWGRYVNDDWLQHNLLYTPPPTSEGYVAPSAYDPSEPVTNPIDELDAAITEQVVIHMGVQGGQHFEYHQALVYWYAHLMADRQERSREECLKKMSKRLHISFIGADRLLRDAVSRFWDMRQSAKPLDNMK